MAAVRVCATVQLGAVSVCGGELGTGWEPLGSSSVRCQGEEPQPRVPNRRKESPEDTGGAPSIPAPLLAAESSDRNGEAVRWPPVNRNSAKIIKTERENREHVGSGCWRMAAAHSAIWPNTAESGPLAASFLFPSHFICIWKRWHPAKRSKGGSRRYSTA